MRKLIRGSVPAPACLATYTPGAHNWGDLAPEHKAEIRTSLEQLQGKRCAYCECDLDTFGQHIEHFRRKHVFQNLTFAWQNLFWSCDCSECCGQFKDTGAGPYNPDDLIDPTVDDPDHFFQFTDDGRIRVRGTVTPAEEHRAKETLRVFNLQPDHGRLRNMRFISIRQFVGDLRDQLTGWSPEDRAAYLQQEIALTSREPFATCIRHVLESLI